MTEPQSATPGGPNGADPADSASDALFTPPAPTLDKKKKRAALIQGAITLAIFFVIFGWLLPKVIDYQEVFDAISALEWWQFLVLLIAGLLVYLPEGWLYSLVVPVLTWWQGIKSWVASTGVGSTIPAMDLVVRFGMYRSWGATPDRAMMGIFMSGIFDNIVKFSLPVLSVLVLLATGAAKVPGVVIAIAVVAALMVAATLLVVIGVARSERFARWLAGTIERTANWLLRRLHRDPLTGTEAKVIAIRDATTETISHVWGRAFLASAMGKLWTFVILLIALQFAGLAGVISPGQAFVVWTLVLLVQAIPLTPGGIGFVEAAYLALFTAIAGDQYATQVAAAIALYRAAQWALPIPVGWLTVLWWRLNIRRGRISDPFSTSPSPSAG